MLENDTSPETQIHTNCCWFFIRWHWWAHVKHSDSTETFHPSFLNNKHTQRKRRQSQERKVIKFFFSATKNKKREDNLRFKK